MSWDWGPEGPPPEAYERITDPERFRGLHQAARTLLDDLEARYEVDREYFLDHTRPSGPEPGERLVPHAPGASPLAVTYAESPGLLIYTGHQRRGAHIPVCACDACDETLETCLDQLPQLIGPVVAGTFGESVVIEDGRWYHHVWRTWSAGRSSGTGLIDEEQAKALLELMPAGEASWQPWTPRSGPTPTF